MWTILLTVMMYGTSKGEPAVSLITIGSYSSVSACQAVAAQVEKGYPSSIDAKHTYSALIIPIARCVQVKDKP